MTKAGSPARSPGRLETGVRNLDAVLGGGLPKGSVTVLSGPPGSGKTILAEQVCFHNASAERRVLYFSTLSEPTAKTLRYLAGFEFFDETRFGEAVKFVDMGQLLRAEGLEETSALIMATIKEVKPALVVIDSFKTFDDLSRSKGELRKFGYGLAVHLMAWEATCLLIGEYGPDEHVANPLFSVIDGLILMSQREASGEQQRFLQVVKMRGTAHSRDEHPFVISPGGIEVFAPRVTIHREPDARFASQPRCRTGIEKLDLLLGEGISRGSSLLIAGVAGTGKTVLSLEFILRGAQQGERGILFSFEETTDRLLASALGMGWELQREIDRGMVELVFIPQPEIAVEAHLLMIGERVTALGARRVAIDSISVFLHKVQDPQVCREKVFQLATIVQNCGAVGFFCTDVPYGSDRISRFGVEETVVDGVIILSAVEEGLERQRYLEVYKLRNSAHLKGRHHLVIGKGGIQLFPRYGPDVLVGAPAALEVGERLSTGVSGLDERLSGGLLRRSATLLAGSAGIGKTTLGLQFLIEGAARGEAGIMLTLEESREQLLDTAEACGLALLRGHVEARRIEVMFLSHEYARPAQLLTLLGDAVVRTGARRVFVDSATHIARDGLSPEQLRQLMFRLVARFKALGATCVLAVESTALYFGGDITEWGNSPVADVILLMRYVETGGELRPALRIIKSRGSAHDRRTLAVVHGSGGLRVGPPFSEPSTGAS